MCVAPLQSRAAPAGSRLRYSIPAAPRGCGWVFLPGPPVPEALQEQLAGETLAVGRQSRAQLAAQCWRVMLRPPRSQPAAALRRIHALAHEGTHEVLSIGGGSPGGGFQHRATPKLPKQHPAEQLGCAAPSAAPQQELSVHKGCTDGCTPGVHVVSGDGCTDKGRDRWCPALQHRTHSPQLSATHGAAHAWSCRAGGH